MELYHSVAESSNLIGKEVCINSAFSTAQTVAPARTGYINALIQGHGHSEVNVFDVY